MDDLTKDKVYLTPDIYRRASYFYRTNVPGGFGVMLMAAWHCAMENQFDDFLRRFALAWPLTENLLWFSGYPYAAGGKANEESDLSPLPMLAAAILHADKENLDRIEQGWPGFVREMTIRYNTPGGLLPGEEDTIDGVRYRCVGDAWQDAGGWHVKTKLEVIEAVVSTE